MSSTIEITKSCEWCGSTFIARKCTTRYCSKRCAEHAYKDAKRKEHVAKEQSKANSPKTIESSPFISPTQCARLLGVSRRSIYNYLAANSIPCYQFKGKTLISKESLNALFDGSHLYQLRPTKEKQPITEFYTTKDVLEKFNISNSWLFKAAKENNFPKTTQRGKTLWSKPHIDRFFAKSAPKEEITEWYTAAERQDASESTMYSDVKEAKEYEIDYECMKYLDKHPNGEHSQEVSDILLSKMKKDGDVVRTYKLGRRYTSLKVGTELKELAYKIAETKKDYY